MKKILFVSFLIFLTTSYSQQQEPLRAIDIENQNIWVDGIMNNLNIDQKMVDSERGVVTSERSTGLENSNFRKLHEEVKAVAFRAHPYSWGVIGHQSDIDNWSLQDLKDYHKTYYAPNNAVVVITGDVTLEQVKKLAKKYFEPIKAQPKPRKIHTVEPEQLGERRTYVQKPSITSANLLIKMESSAL